MIIEFFRSSSYNNWDYCQQQYFLNYVLGLPRSEAKKALKGTIAHKVLECLAVAKQKFDKSPDAEYIELREDIGNILIRKSEFLTRTDLTVDEIYAINRTRTNKYTYLHKCDLKPGAYRLGVNIVEELIRKTYDTYSVKCEGWQPVDLKDIRNFVWMALEHKHGQFDPRMRRIVAPEQAFSFNIEEDWAKIDYTHPCTGIKRDGYLGIKGTIDLVTEIKPGVYEIVDWKGLPVDTKIPTIDGWKTMGDLVIGDIIFDKDGNHTKVLAKSKKSFKPCYKIEFDDKTEVICDNEHLWLLDDNSIVDAPNLKIGNKISVTKAINNNTSLLPIDPYVLGLWLGDGRKRGGEICGNDDFVFDEVVRRGYSLGDNLEKRPGFTQSKTILGLRTELAKLNLLNDKHIPLIYLRASYEQRLDLLRGLMDSDGNANISRKQCIFTNCNKLLATNVKELLLSLGQRVNYFERTRSTNFKDEVSVVQLAFRPININPFLLPRKADLINPNWGPGKSDKRVIKNIVLLNTNLETQCISVDSPSNTYLCTENFIPTHNTGQRKDWATGEEKTYKKLCNDFQLKLYHYAAHRVFPEAKQIILTIFFVRHGGPYTICFDKESLKETEEIIKGRFEEIKNSTIPKLCDPTQRDFRCQKLCDYYNMPAPDGKSKNFCKYAHEYIKKHGVEKATADLTYKGHDINKYDAPGDI